MITRKIRRKRIFPHALTLLFLSFCIFANPALAAAPPLAENGTSDFQIVVPDQATESERYAAEELQSFLKQISGALLPIVAESRAPQGPAVHVGLTISANQFAARAHPAPLGAEEFVIHSDQESGILFIVGGRPRGALYGVYSFLEDVLGCRWYAPGVSRIPAADTIQFPDINVTQAPAFEYREPFFYHAFDADWAARNKANGATPDLKEKHGGKISYSHFVHTYNALVPPSMYFDEHPEYFTEITDPNVRDKTQLCVTNPDVLDISRREVMKWMDDAPDATIFSVSQNDNINYCKRDGDAALEKQEGSPAGPLLHFVNAVADYVAEKHPDKLVDTLAYQYTENAPENVRPRDNVVVRLCHMAPSCDTHPLDKCFWNAKYMKNLRAWTDISKHVYVWHYVTNFSHYLMPFPDVKAIARDIPTYYKYGVDGIFAQGSYQSQGGNFAELKAWLIARLLWDPEQDAKALIEEFFQGYYGPAAQPMMDYFQALHKTVSDPNAHAHLYTGPIALFLPRDVLLYADDCFDRAEAAAAGDCFDRAEAAAAGDEALLTRIQRDRLGLTYVKLTAPHLYGWVADELKPGASQDQFARLEKFAADLERLNVTKIDEWHTREEMVEKLREMVSGQISGQE